MSILKKFLVVLALFPVVGLSLFLFTGVLNYAGVCVARLDRLSDKELIISAVTIVNNDTTINLNEGRVGKVFEKIPYASVDAFLNENPNCCHVTVGTRTGDDSAAPGMLSRMFGRYRGDVNISYVAKYLDGGKIQAKKINGGVPLDNCGSRSD